MEVCLERQRCCVVVHRQIHLCAADSTSPGRWEMGALHCISGHFQLILIVVMMMYSKILDEGRHIIPNTWFKNGSHHVFAYTVLVPF